VQISPDEQQTMLDGEKETGRLEAFSDGVFAVAITLLVLDVTVITISSPEKLPGDTEVWASALAHLPQISAFVVSFFTIGIMWVNHHKIFKHIKRTDSGLLLLNLLLLMVIVLIPVPTSLLAYYLLATSQHAAAIIYSGTFFLMAVCFNTLWRYATYRGRLLGKDANMQEVAAITKQYLFGPTLYIIPLALAFINTPLSAIAQFLLALFFALPSSPVRSKSTQAKEKERL
jgi:uncharacterized membrane protein